MKRALILIATAMVSGGPISAETIDARIVAAASKVRGVQAVARGPLAELLDLQTPVHAQSAPRGFALWRLGFRPFYLLASIFASSSIALWGAQYAGWLSAPYLSGPIWHAHEMLFGFTLAVMTGSLFTAVRNWTSRSTSTGIALAALAGLWLAGRVLVLTPYGVAAAAVNTLLWLSGHFCLIARLGLGVRRVQARQ